MDESSSNSLGSRQSRGRKQLIVWRGRTKEKRNVLGFQLSKKKGGREQHREEYNNNKP